MSERDHWALYFPRERITLKERPSTKPGVGAPAAKGTTEYKTMPFEDALRELGSVLEGLSEAEVEKRLKTYGRNEVASRKKNPILEFLSRFWGPMPWLLELAIVLAVFLGHDLEAFIIAILIVTNAIIGYLHSRSSQKSLELLKERLAVNAVVRREGRWVTINASEIVPGDIAVVQMGDIVPADAKVLSGALSVDQSAIDGRIASRGGRPFGHPLLKLGRKARRGSMPRGQYGEQLPTSAGPRSLCKSRDRSPTRNRSCSPS